LEISDALRRDAETMAEQMGISVDDALRRIGYQDDIGRLRAELATNERDTFAGLWVDHQPEYRIVVQFTRDAEQTIRPYIEDKPWAGLVEVRTASATLSALEAALAETVRDFDWLDFDVTTALNEKGNRVEVYVTDPAWFERELRKANIQLPDHVELVTVAGHSAKEIDICAPSSVPGVAFPHQAPVEGIWAVMDAELIGDLVLANGCLRVNSIYGDASYLPVWPPEFTLKSENDTLQVLDGAGRQTVAILPNMWYNFYNYEN
jgi:hypothetical protein